MDMGSYNGPHSGDQPSFAGGHLQYDIDGNLSNGITGWLDSALVYTDSISSARNGDGTYTIAALGFRRRGPPGQYYQRHQAVARPQQRFQGFNRGVFRGKPPENPALRGGFARRGPDNHPYKYPHGRRLSPTLTAVRPPSIIIIPGWNSPALTPIILCHRRHQLPPEHQHCRLLGQRF